jgi:GH18 family chitinase
LLAEPGFDVDALNANADYVQVMNYDFHIYSASTPLTGLNAPLKVLLAFLCQILVVIFQTIFS